MRLEVNMDSAAVLAGLDAHARALVDTLQLHLEMAQAVEAEVMGYLLQLNSRSPHTSFYGKAARSTQVSATQSGAMVSITHRGLALRYYGGRVLPRDAKNLALPTAHVPLAGSEGRKGPREVGPLAFLPNRRGPSITTGYLVEGVEKVITRGKRKGGKRIVPKEGGKLMFVLRGWTDHEADATVLPAEAQLTTTAAEAAVTYLNSIPEL